MRIAVIAASLMLGAPPAAAEPAGPPVPTKPKTPLAEQAIRHAAALDAPAPDCGKGKAGEIIVCGGPDARSPYRLPLPNERRSVPHSGDFAKVDIGTGPVPVKPGMTVARFGMSKAAKTRNATLKLIYAQDAAKAATERARLAAIEAAALLQPEP